MDKIRATIITGFLGSGKTTLLNALLKNYPNIKFAIIENEFGEASIDSEILNTGESNEIYELTNGCICCTVTDDFTDTLLELSVMENQPDWVLIETTGIADPASVISTFLQNNRVTENYQLDGTVCIVDCLNFDSQLTEEEAYNQVLAGDIVLLNKTDLVSQDKKHEIEKLIHEINPFAKVYEMLFGSTNAKLLNMQAFDSESINSDFNKLRPVRSSSKHTGITSETFTIEQAFSQEQFMLWLEYFLNLNSKAVFRVKGILYFKEQPYKMILQAVKSSFTIADGDFWGYGEIKKSELVFIGKNLNRLELLDTLNFLLTED